MTHYVRSQEDWDRLVEEGELKSADEVYIYESVSVENYRDGFIDFTVTPGGSVVASSSVDNWYFLEGDNLTLKWDGKNGANISVDTSEGVTVTLVDYPDGVTPLTSANGVGKATFVRKTSESTVLDGAPAHYIWVGRAITENGGPVRTEYLQSWDILDALFPDDPHLWNAGKYLTRCSRKGGREKRGEDLRKALTYLERAIEKEERRAQ